MSEKIANCPLCRKEPKVCNPWLSSQIDEAQLKQTWPQYACCGHIACGPDAWNQHAAAMELEQLRSRYYHECDNMSKKEQKELLDMIYVANKRVLELFK